MTDPDDFVKLTAHKKRQVLLPEISEISTQRHLKEAPAHTGLLIIQVIYVDLI